MKAILELKDIRKGDASTAGGKGANLGELMEMGILVPDGFVISTDVYKTLVKESALLPIIRELLHNLNVEDTKILQEVSDKIQSLITSASLPQGIEKEIIKAYEQLGGGLVAVRSSATAEDLNDASFAGQQDTFLNIDGKEALLDSVRKCMASLFTGRAIYYRTQKKFDHTKVSIAVVIQKMVEAQKAGVVFSINPISNNQSEMVIEAASGLGEAVVGGKAIPDNYVVQKETGSILESHLAGARLLLSSSEIYELAKLTKIIEAHYGFPQDIEWAKENEDFFILQSRPVTTLAVGKDTGDLSTTEKPILMGLGASQGIKSGKVRLILDVRDISSIKFGEVLVTGKTSPDLIEAFGKVIAIITNLGGITSHAAIVSRELGIPAVVGTKSATYDLKNGDIVTVDGNSGKVYRGELQIKSESRVEQFAYKVEKSGDEITDMVNSICSAVIDARELWPVGPGQLFSYIDFDQTYDMYKKLKSLRYHGWSFKQIAELFENPTAVRFFMMNSASTGLKTGTSLKLAHVTLDDNVQMFTWLIEILKNLTQEDPFCMEGKNIIWSKEQLDIFVSENHWVGLAGKPSLRAAVNLLSVNLFTLCWSFYTDYFGANGSERHGPYNVDKEKFGKNAKLLIRDFFDLKPEEVWPVAKYVPFKSVLLAQVYNDIPVYINWGNALVNQKSLTTRNSFFILLVDGKPMLKEKEIEAFIEKIGKIIQEQTDLVNSLELKDKIRKCAMLSYYGLRKFHLHFSDKWYPEKALENAFKIIGDGPLKLAQKEDRTPEQKKALFDPRISWSP